MSQLVDRMGQVNKLKNGIGIQKILDEAYKILGNPLFLFSTDRKLIAYTEAETDDPIWNEMISTGTFSNPLWRLFGKEGFIEDVANASKAILLRSENIKYDQFAGRVFNGNHAYVASLMMSACKKPIEEYDLMVFEAICKLITKEISRIPYYLSYELLHQERVINRLVDGNYDIKLDMAQVGILYETLRSGLYIVAADVSCSPKPNDIAHYRDLLRQMEPGYKYAVYGDSIIIIVSNDDETLNVSRELSKLIKFFEENGIYAGVSSKFENLFELQKYYGEARKAMQFTLERKSAQHIFPYYASSVDVMEQIEALQNGAGIQYFLDLGPKIFGNPLLFHDMELNLLAYSKNVEIADPIWQELITYGTSSDETINLFKTEGFISTMENTKGGAVLISEKIKYDRISWRAYSNDNIMIGCLSIVNTITPFHDDTLVLFGAFGQKFSKEVGKIEFYNSYGRLYSDCVINRLLSGKIDDYTFYSEDIGNLYNALMDNLYLAVLDTSQCSSEQVNLAYVRELFNRPDSVNRYAIHADYIIVIISTEGTSLNENHELDEISRVFVQNHMYAGISRCFENIYDLQKYYIETVEVLKAGIAQLEDGSGQRVFLCENSSQEGDML